MKLILTADVDNLGVPGDTVEVKDGYGRNFLLPRGLAIVASRGAERQADEIRRARELKTVRGLEHANELKIALEGLDSVELPVNASADTGKLFGSVTATSVVAAIKKAGGPNLDKRTVSAAQGPHQGARRAPGRPCVCTPTCRPRSRSTSSPSNNARDNTPGLGPLRVPTRA